MTILELMEEWRDAMQQHKGTVARQVEYNAKLEWYKVLHKHNIQDIPSLKPVCSTNKTNSRLDLEVVQ